MNEGILNDSLVVHCCSYTSLRDMKPGYLRNNYPSLGSQFGPYQFHFYC